MEDLNLERILNSREFRDLYKNISENNSPLSDLPEVQRKLAVYLWSIGKDNIINELQELLYSRKVPTIEEFLTYEYLGLLNNFLFPKWRNCLKEIFAPESMVWEVVLGGAIGVGKTTFAGISQTYNLIRVLSLRNPQMTLGIPPTSLLFVQLITVNLLKAELALLRPYLEIIRSCSLFEEVKKESDFNDFKNGDKIPFIDQNDKASFPHNTMILTGSKITHTLGNALIGAVLDEAEFRTGGSIEGIEVYTNLKERSRSRFADSYKFLMLNLISSARYTTGVIAEYVKKLPKNSVHTKYYAYPIWEVKEFDSYEKGSFYAMRGTRTHPSFILNDSEARMYEEGKFIIPPNCEVLKIPLTYKEEFVARPDNAFRNLAGIQTFGYETLFDDLNHIEFRDLVPEVTVELRLGERQRLSDQLPKNAFLFSSGKIRLSRYPNTLRFCHLDLAETSEGGLTILHKELGDEGQIIYVTDFVIKIVTTTRIDLDAIYNFLLWLHNDVGVSFYSITADQYQSAHLLQKCITDKLATEVKVVSLERTPEPYRQLSDIIYHKQFHCGISPTLKTQLQAIVEDEGKIISTIRKDVADSVAGAAHNAIMNTRDQPTNPRFMSESILDLLQKQHKAQSTEESFFQKKPTITKI